MFNAKTTILANGGAGQAYQPTTNGLIVTGDGIAQAYRIGARLMDMEMIQYHPTTLAGNGLLITEGARGEGAWLLNAEGERFMEKYAPNKLELASRDVVSRAEQTEINEGRGFPDGTVALDITKVPRRRTLEALREIVNIGRDFAGVDITREPIHIHPGQHYIMGGVKTDVDGQTTIPGLYAAGEVACVSVHGGNRLGANSLLDTLIFGRRSGEHAAGQAHPHADADHPGRPGSPTPSRRSTAIINRPAGGRRVSAIKDELGDTMNKYVAVFRDAEGLAKAHEIVRRLKEEAPKAAIDDRGTVFNQDVIGAIELGYMLDCAEAIVVAAQERKESRGRPVPHRLPRAQRRRMAQAHRRLGQRRRRAQGQLLAGDDHQVGAPGKDVLALMPEYTLKIRRFDPKSGEAAYWDEHQVDLERAQLGPGRDPQGPRRGRRLGRHPLLLPAGDLRLLRRADERQAGAGLQHPPRRGRRPRPRHRLEPARRRATRRPPASSRSSRWATCR